MCKDAELENDDFSEEYEEFIVSCTEFFRLSDGRLAVCVYSDGDQLFVHYATTALADLSTDKLREVVKHIRREELDKISIPHDSAAYDVIKADSGAKLLEDKWKIYDDPTWLQMTTVMRYWLIEGLDEFWINKMVPTNDKWVYLEKTGSSGEVLIGIRARSCGDCEWMLSQQLNQMPDYFRIREVSEYNHYKDRFQMVENENGLCLWREWNESEQAYTGDWYWSINYSEPDPRNHIGDDQAMLEARKRALIEFKSLYDVVAEEGN